MVDEQFEPSRSKNKLAKGVARLSKALGFQELTISVANVNVNPERLIEFIMAMRNADKPNRETILKQALPGNKI